MMHGEMNAEMDESGVHMRVWGRDLVIVVSKERADQAREVARTILRTPFLRRTWSEFLFLSLGIPLAVAIGGQEGGIAGQHIAALAGLGLLNEGKHAVGLRGRQLALPQIPPGGMGVGEFARGQDPRDRYGDRQQRHDGDQGPSAAVGPHLRKFLQAFLKDGCLFCHCAPAELAMGPIRPPNH